MARKMEEIQQEYQLQAALLGECVYKIEGMKADAFRMRRALKRLNQEAEKLNARQQRNAVSELVAEQQPSVEEASNGESSET